MCCGLNFGLEYILSPAMSNVLCVTRCAISSCRLPPSTCTPYRMRLSLAAPPHTTVFAALESLCCSVPLLVSLSTLQRV